MYGKNKKNYKKKLTKNKKIRKQVTKKYKRRQPNKKKYIGGFVNTAVAGQTAIANVKNILFTQNSVSHSFTGFNNESTLTSVYNYILEKKNYYGVGNFNVEFLKYAGIPENLYKLEILVGLDGKFYSCNNRRLCLLKNLLNIGFDGDVECTAVANCHHDITLSPNVFIQKGNQPGQWCL